MVIHCNVKFSLEFLCLCLEIFRFQWTQNSRQYVYIIFFRSYSKSVRQWPRRTTELSRFQSFHVPKARNPRKSKGEHKFRIPRDKSLRLTHRVLSPYIDFFILSSQKSRSFRWSIDQISRLVSSPTDTLKFTVHYPILCRSDPRFVFTSKLIVII